MRLIVATDENETDDQTVNYIDAEAFARVWFIVMENKHRRAAEHLRASENEQDCPACHGKKSYPVNGHDAPCEWCRENGQS